MEIILKKLEKLEVLIKSQNILSKEVLTLEEAALYLSCSKSCVYKMTSAKEITFYIPGGKKIYFKKSELDSWVFSRKIEPIDNEVEHVDMYLARNQKD